jgi:predicted transcriptional regulator
MLEIFGVNKNNELNVTFSREDIANSAGSTRQQITMQLTEFEKDGFIKKCGKKVAMQNVDGLHKILSKYNQHPSYQYFSPSVGTRELFINS